MFFASTHGPLDCGAVEGRSQRAVAKAVLRLERSPGPRSRICLQRAGGTVHRASMDHQCRATHCLRATQPPALRAVRAPAVGRAHTRQLPRSAADPDRDCRRGGALSRSRQSHLMELRRSHLVSFHMRHLEIHDLPGLKVAQASIPDYLHV